LDVNISMFVISTSSFKSLREILIVLSSTIALSSYELNRDLKLLKEMLQSYVISKSFEDFDLREFVEVRYGIADLSSTTESFAFNLGLKERKR
jgi:hypothetical protein